MSFSLRPAAVAGMFYPASAGALGALVDGLLAEVHAPPSEPVPKALIVPHAGYVYSGAIAASAYARVRGARRVRRVVLVGPAHRACPRGLVSAGVTGFVTPLGIVEVDVAALAQAPEVPADPRAHALEHSLEVQLPFLQRVLPGARIVPLAVGDASGDEVARTLSALWGGPETLIIVSSDLSHYLPYENGRALDRETAERIVRLDPRALESERACGAIAIDGLAAIAREKGLRATLLDLRSSGDTAGRRDSVVGYGAFAFHQGGTP